MAEICTVTTLAAKRNEIEPAIAAYEKRLPQVRADLSHVSVCIAIFEASGDVAGVLSYVDTHCMFARGELMTLCKQALASGPKTTKELALHVMAAKALDTGDKVFAHGMATRPIHALRQQWRRGLIQGEGKVKGARVWSELTCESSTTRRRTLPIHFVKWISLISLDGAGTIPYI